MQHDVLASDAEREAAGRPTTDELGARIDAVYARARLERRS